MTADEARAALEQALATIAPEADLATVPDDGDLREELDLDSMDFLGLLTRLDELTGVAVSEDDYDAFSTPARAVRFLVERA